MRRLRISNEWAGMRTHFETAVHHLIEHGESIAFPRSIEVEVFRDRVAEVVDLLCALLEDFEALSASLPPAHTVTLAPARSGSFRWADRLDPLWHAYYLGLIVSLADDIEADRLPLDLGTTLSSRYRLDRTTWELFGPDPGFQGFLERSRDIARSYSHVLQADIADFSGHISHRRLEEDLRRVRPNSVVPERIMACLRQITGGRAWGIPVGDPGTRLLGELAVSGIDRALFQRGIRFARYGDDYVAFANSLDEAYAQLAFLSEAMSEHDLTLHRDKTHIRAAAEFIAGSSKVRRDRSLLRFLAKRRAVASQPDLVAMLAHMPFTPMHQRQTIESVLAPLDAAGQDRAIASLIRNLEPLYPVFSLIMRVVRERFARLSPSTQDESQAAIHRLFDSYVTRPDLHAACAVRVLGCRRSAENERLLGRLYEERTAPFLRSDIVLVMAKWGARDWLAALMRRDPPADGGERRAVLIASHVLGEEGARWRAGVEQGLSPFDRLVSRWAAAKVAEPGWQVPI